MTKKNSNQREQKFTRATPAHARATGSSRAARWISIGLVSVLAFGGSAAYAVQWRINSSVTKIDTKELIAEPVTPKDPRAGESLNILILGTDSRDGDNSGLVGDHVGGQRSDTTMIAHISSDRKRVEVVSIPRDSKVDIPACNIGDGKTTAPSRDQFNSAFSRGWDYGGDYAYAAACTASTVQQTTGLTIDHTVIINFEGFVNMVNSLGGINVRIPETLYSPKASNLCLVEGPQKLDGKTALQLVRARTGWGWGLNIGSDLKRIERQQAVLEATVSTALSKNMVTDLNKLTSFVTASLESLVVDSDLNANTLIALAWSLKDVALDDVVFKGVPVTTDPTNKNHVVWTSEAAEMWTKLSLDETIVEKETPAPSNSGSPSPKPSKSPTKGSETKTPKPSSSSATTAPAKDFPEPKRTTATSYADCFN